MARQEIEGDLWYQSSGRDLLPPSLRVGFRTLFPTSVRNLGSRDICLAKLAIIQALCSCVRPMYQKRYFAHDLIKLSLGSVIRAV